MLDIADSHHLLPMVAGRMSFGAHSRLPSPDIAPSRGRSCSAHSLVKLPRRLSIRRRHGVAVRAAATPEGSVRPKVLSSQDNAGEDCAVFVTPDGSIQEVMCADYGFRSGFGRLYQGGDGEIPKNFFQLGWENFRKEFKQLRRSFRYNEYQEIREASPPTGFVSQLLASTNKRLVGGLASLDTKLEEAGVLPKLEAPQLPEEITDDNGDMTEDVEDVRKKLKALKLDNEPVWDRERLREKDPDRAKAPWFISAAYISLCWAMDVIYTGRPIQRFWFLETVARMPYFSYISMLHLYESLGWWRAGAELRRIHFAEEWNELHHLQIMESLGGDQFWVDRFMAQHAAVFYYWVIVGFFAFSPQTAYIFSELVEGHATDTYEEFVVENEELLKSLPPPLVALEYYKAGDLYFFDALQTTGTDPKRRPACANLYDVFRNIADDEKEHVKTMKACRDYSIVSDLAERKLASRGAVKDGGANGAAPQAVSPLPAKAGNGAGPLPIKNMDTSQLE